MSYAVQQPQGDVVLGKLSGANLNITTDQAIALLVGNKKITRIMVAGASITPTLAAGGFYSAASKGGSVVVAAGQVYTAATAIVTLDVTLASTYFVGSTLYFALTTANGTACTADIYVYGQLLP